MQTIGERLEEARKKKGISIREAAESTKIRGDYLQKFETNHFDIGLTEIYTRGFLRTYANFLKLPADRILNDYAALGRGEARPRTPNREVYGRMDITVASKEETTERPTGTEESQPAEAGAARPAQARSRSATSLPTGPDPAIVFRYIKWGGVIVILLLVVVIIKSLFNDRPSATPPRPSTAAPTTATPPVAAPTRGPAERTMTLHALNTVTVRVNRKHGEDEGEELFNGTLRRGEQHALTFTGGIYISFNAGENLEIEHNGKRYNRSNFPSLNGRFRIAME
jgi:cytoskeleton protein RodZ